jgi:hypothetical protein
MSEEEKSACSNISSHVFTVLGHSHPHKSYFLFGTEVIFSLFNQFYKEAQYEAML